MGGLNYWKVGDCRALILWLGAQLAVFRGEVKEAHTDDSGQDVRDATHAR